MRTEFLFRLPGGKHLYPLDEVEKIMDTAIADNIYKDFSAFDKIMVEIYDSRILAKNEPATATLGKMSVSSAIHKFS